MAKHRPDPVVPTEIVGPRNLRGQRRQKLKPGDLAAVGCLLIQTRHALHLQTGAGNMYCEGGFVGTTIHPTNTWAA